MVPAAASSRDRTSKRRTRPEARSERSSGSKMVGAEEKGMTALEEGDYETLLPLTPLTWQRSKPVGRRRRASATPLRSSFHPGGLHPNPATCGPARLHPRSRSQIPPVMVRAAILSRRNAAPTRPIRVCSISPSLPEPQPEPEAKAPPPHSPHSTCWWCFQHQPTEETLVIAQDRPETTPRFSTGIRTTGNEYKSSTPP
jgi:hypothetical protein